MAQQLTAWSFSRYQTYKECPAKAKYKFIDKMKEPPAPAMERGILMHKSAEDYTKGVIKKLPDALKNFKTEFSKVKKLNPIVEQEWAFDKMWKPTGWFDWNAWLRVKLDLGWVKDKTLNLVDHKSGKPKDDHIDQLDLYAVTGMTQMPEIETVSAQVWYLDHPGEVLKQDFPRTDVLKLRKGWNDKTRAMLSDKTFTPRPGNYCRYCTFSKSKGGPCKF